MGSSPRRSRAATSAGPVAPRTPTGTSVYTPSSAQYAPQASKSLRYRSSQKVRTSSRLASVVEVMGSDAIGGDAGVTSRDGHHPDLGRRPHLGAPHHVDVARRGALSRQVPP